MSFGLVVAAQVLLFAGSNLPTPLFPIYEHRYGFGPGVVTLLFGSYIAILVPALVLLGPVADRVGRRPLLVAGIAVTAISSTAFAAARSLGWLFAGELSYGIASALVMSCVSITIRELHPTHDVAAGSLAASVAMAVGMVLGPLTSGVLADATPWPATAPYVVDICLASLLSVALLRIPETRPPRGTTSARVARLHVPSEIRPAFAGPAAMGAATFMFVGWVFGLSPSFLHDDLNVHITRPLVGGLFAALVAFAMGVSQLVLRAHHGHRPAARALFAVVAGMGTIAASSATRCLAMAVVGGVVAGVGAGIAQMSAMAAVQTVAPPRTRTGIMSTYVTVCYLALSVPVVIAGEAADQVGLATVTAWYVIAVTVVVVLALRLSRRISTGLCSAEPAPAAPPVGGMRHAAATA